MVEIFDLVNGAEKFGLVIGRLELIQLHGQITTS